MSLIINVYHDTTLHGELLLKPLTKSNSIICERLSSYPAFWLKALHITHVALAILSYPISFILACIGMISKFIDYEYKKINNALHPKIIPKENDFFSKHNMDLLSKLEMIREAFNAKETYSYQDSKDETHYPNQVYFAGYYTPEKFNDYAHVWNKIQKYVVSCMDFKKGIKVYILPYVDNYYDNDDQSACLNILLFADKPVTIEKEASKENIDPGFLKRASNLPIANSLLKKLKLI